MDAAAIKRILDEVASGLRLPDEALSLFRDLPFAELGVAKHDSHRPLRNGFSEVILCEGKETGHILRIIEGMASRGVNIFGTRASAEIGHEVVSKFPKAEYDPLSRTIRLVSRAVDPMSGKLAILCAGTADLAVAEEARRTAEFFGIEASRHYDVGVAGLHRLLDSIGHLREAHAIIAVAGMEGALPSVVGGLVAAPVIACPTSVGYGAGFSGVTALLAMLSACSEGICVVNIDNGFGAACAALRILRSRARA